MRAEESEANFTGSRVVSACRFPRHDFEQVRSFQTQIHLLMNTFSKFPDPTELFEWYFMQFEQWPPLAGRIKIVKQAKPVHVIRKIGYIWVQVEEELVIHYAEKCQAGWMQEVQRMPKVHTYEKGGQKGS